MIGWDSGRIRIADIAVIGWVFSEVPTLSGAKGRDPYNHRALRGRRSSSASDGESVALIPYEGSELEILSGYSAPSLLSGCNNKFVRIAPCLNQRL
jgi:hypothetical protein